MKSLKIFNFISKNNSMLQTIIRLKIFKQIMIIITNNYNNAINLESLQRKAKIIFIIKLNYIFLYKILKAKLDFIIIITL